MKKLIRLFSIFALVSIHFPLVSCFKNDKLNQCNERFTILPELRVFLGLMDKNCSPKVQPFFDNNYNLVMNNTDMFDFNNKEYLNKTFLDKQKRAKDGFVLYTLTTF